MSWKRVLFYSVISLMGLDIVAASPRASTDDIQFDPNKQQSKQETTKQNRFKSSTQRMLLERKFLIAQKQKLHKIAKTNPRARKYIRIINLQLLYIERELKAQKDTLRPKA